MTRTKKQNGTGNWKKCLSGSVLSTSANNLDVVRLSGSTDGKHCHAIPEGVHVLGTEAKRIKFNRYWVWDSISHFNNARRSLCSHQPHHHCQHYLRHTSTTWLREHMYMYVAHFTVRVCAYLYLVGCVGRQTSVYAKRSPLAISGEFKQKYTRSCWDWDQMFVSNVWIFLCCVLHCSAEPLSRRWTLFCIRSMFYTTPTHNSQILLFVLYVGRCVFSCAFAWRALRILFTSSMLPLFVVFFLFVSAAAFFRCVCRPFLDRDSLCVFCEISCCEYNLHNTKWRRRNRREEKKNRQQLEVPRATPTAKRTQSYIKLSSVAAACRARQTKCILFITKFWLLCNLCWFQHNFGDGVFIALHTHCRRYINHS